VSAVRDGVATDKWDAALHAIGGHFLQSAGWQRVQQELGQQVVHAEAEGWVWAGPLRLGAFPRYLYLPYGPAAGDALPEALRAAVSAARERELDFIRVEPASAGASVTTAVRTLTAAGASAVRAVQPRHTWVLDLRPGVDQLRRGLSAGHRGAVNAAPRKGVAIQSSRDPAAVTALVDLQRRNAGSSGWQGESARYHRIEAEVLMPGGAATVYSATADGEVVAAAMCFDWMHTRYYAHAAADPVRGRKLGASAPLVWQMILDAKAGGFTAFDFWGVAPAAPRGHPWAGFTQFKMAFGGELVTRGGTWEIPVRGLRHRLYSVLRRR